VKSQENKSDGMTKSLGVVAFKKFINYCFNWDDGYLDEIQTGNGLNVHDQVHASAVNDDASDDSLIGSY